MRSSILYFVATCAFFLVSLPLIYGAVPPDVDDAGNEKRYEVWASDQSNSAPGQSSLGVLGSYLWIWDSVDIEKQLSTGNDAEPLSCSPVDAKGPCDILKVFPQDLREYTDDGIATGAILGQLPAFGRLHGMIHDKSNRYVTVNMYAPGGGYVGIIDVRSKEAVALFRATSFDFGDTDLIDRVSAHMSLWTADGSAIIVNNLHGKAIERINVMRDGDRIVGLYFDRSATLGLGKNQRVNRPASFFLGKNAFGRSMIGSTVGSYEEADLGHLTLSGYCKEDGCECGDFEGCQEDPGRPNNLPICPIPSDNDNIFITLAGGGLFVADSKMTPMTIKGEYGNSVVYGAGCGGVQVGETMFMNSGISGSSAGATQSMFSVWAFDDSAYNTVNGPNEPLPDIVYNSPTNTNTGGNVGSLAGSANLSGQSPGETTRSDSHGAAATTNGEFVHVADRIQNLIEVFPAKRHPETGMYSDGRSTYDLTTDTGLSTGQPGKCLARSVADDSNLPVNDPAPDLFEETPDGKYMMIAFRGPAPTTVSHSAQGSCPGVGIVELSKTGNQGKLLDVLRTTNTLPDQIDVVAAVGGHAYTGRERSDIHAAAVIPK